MDERMIKNREEIDIDVQRLISVLLNKVWLCFAVAVLAAVLTFAGTFFFMTPKYQSSAMFYVNNSASSGEASLGISSADISASRGLVKSYIVILNTRETLNDVIAHAGVNRTYEQLKTMISAAAVDSTEIFQVLVTSPDPQEAERIANAIGYVLPKRISSVIEGASAKVVDAAVVPSGPSSPNYLHNTLLGFGAGFLLAAGWIVLRALMDVTIRTEEDIAQNSDQPVLTSVPDMDWHHKGGSYYGYIRKNSREKSSSQKSCTELVGGGISFAAAEAYKLLRTKLQFSFADESGCRVIGVSSAVSGEGKSLTAVNLAYSMSQLGKRVLMMECDMRCPSLAEKLPVQKTPGLSDFLSGQIPADQLLQLCGIKGEERAFHAIVAGRVPSNPMELLSSARMVKLMERLRQNYDYIIMDLPPVGEVGDALAVSKLADGMLLVVRQNYCSRIVLNSAIRQFTFMDARILGIVLNATTEFGGRYGQHYQQRYFGQYNSRQKRMSPEVKKKN